MKKPRLLLLSDLFGGNPKWVEYYIKILEVKYDIQYYDVLELAQMNSINTEVKIHNQFLNGGLEKAVVNLLAFEKEKVAVLGFSIGGTIAWKASLKGLKITEFVAVSSTRLRFETEMPNCKVKLYYGEKDLNKPNEEWFLDLKISNQTIENRDHLLYKEKEIAFLFCSNFL
ncbi:alpha/beta hydrolase [Flavobacterium tyrosinilyticum]|uniref:alpha/beta hydrolase n=1 Tax=Flavobacterium tyrosinilyticum TaxID=1658740 RepID=UPI0020300974|nr:alpha/beta hydrolase [Flavobacterium tyrosinilyticum]MCM0664962.1 alpha/beta hydrolase [Flavobacterium tyrosinilyticum]